LSARVTGTLRRRQGVVLHHHFCRARELSRRREIERERRRDAERDLSISCRTRFIPSLVVERVLQSFFNHCSDVAVEFFCPFLLLLLLCQSESTQWCLLAILSPGLAFPYEMHILYHSSASFFFNLFPCSRHRRVLHVLAFFFPDLLVLN
jgi:hypothetical protein